MFTFSPFRSQTRTGADWFPVGPASAFPDLGVDSSNPEDQGALSQPRLCNSELKPGCKVFHVPRENSLQRTEVPLAADADDKEASDIAGDLTDQVLVFQYRGKFHAIDHVSNPDS